MTLYQKCPLCNGQGHVEKPPGIPGDVMTWTSSTAIHRCRMCFGIGIIPVQIEEKCNDCENANHTDQPIEIPIKQKNHFKMNIAEKCKNAVEIIRRS